LNFAELNAEHRYRVADFFFKVETKGVKKKTKECILKAFDCIYSSKMIII